MTMTIDKLWCDKKYRPLKKFYEKYDNDVDRIANTPPHINPKDWEAFVKIKSNNEFKASISHFVMVVYIIIMFM